MEVILKQRVLLVLMLLGLVILGASFKAWVLPRKFEGLGKSDRSTYRRLAKVPILAYHGVIDGQIEGKNYDLISKGTLEGHFDYISKNFYPITIDELLAYYRNEIDFADKRPILLFFDDGLRSVYEYAFPLAKEYGVEFTVAFLPSGREPYPSDGKMTWQELGEMKESGLIEVASHSFDHFDLTSLTQDELRYQLTASKEIIEENLGPCPHLVAPYGKSDERVRQVAREVGYRSLFVHGRTVIKDDSLFDPFVIKRIAVSSDYGIKDLSKLK